MSESPTAAELRAKILALTYSCPRGDYTRDCPFGVLKGLSHESRLSTLASLGVPELLRLFDLVKTCECPADPRKAPPT